MQSSDFVLVQGVRNTRSTLAEWNDRPLQVTGAWALGSLAISIGLLAAVGIVGALSTPDPSRILLPGLQTPAELTDAMGVLGRNSLVLALHAMACVAGFIAGSSLPLEAERYSGAWRWVHDRAGPLAIAFVCGATLFSLCTQAFVLGGSISSLSAQLGVPIPVLLIGLLPHAVPELVALFLPLAAWIIASRQENWHELLAATFVTVALATPVLILASMIEVYVTPDILRSLATTY